MDKFDVVALGELLIDFTPSGKSQQNNQLLEVNPGGAPCNVLALVSRLGGKTAFLGKVGDDSFGNLLMKTVSDLNIDVRGLIKDSNYLTTLAFVHLEDNGERSFSFYRKPGADMMLTKSEVNTEIIKQAKIFHLGTLSMTNEPVCAATKHAVTLAKNENILVSFDPNYRPLLWNSLDEAKTQISWGLSMCDILKVSDDELELISGTGEIELGLKYLTENYPSIKLIFVTLGKNGCCYQFGETIDKATGIENSTTIDTTGAGDTFFGACLYHIAKIGIENINHDNLKEIVNFANAAASIITTRRGALKAMPSKDEIINHMKNANYTKS